MTSSVLRAHRPGVGEALAIALWCGFLFGLAEGVLLCISRAFPMLRAPYKVSEAILWAAPLFDIAIFSAVALVLLLLVRNVPGLARHALLVIAGATVWLGSFAAFNTLGLVHRWSVLLLATGFTVMLLGRLRARAPSLLESMQRRAWLVPAFILLLAAGTTAWSRGVEAARVRALPALAGSAANVLYIVLDTVRRDGLEDGADEGLAPNLQQLAEQGTRYTDAWASSSWSLPSHATLLTGAYPAEHGADWPRLALSPAHATLAELLAQRGYVTGSFSGNANWVTPEYLGRGFHRFHVYTLEHLFLRTTLGRTTSDVLLKRLGIHPAGRGKRAPQLTQELLAFLDDHRGRPYFAYVTFMDVNQTFHRRRYQNRFWQEPASLSEVKQAYREGLQQLDTDVRVMLEMLRQGGALENTIVVITSDHGESFGAELGDHDPIGHGSSLYPEQTRVPLLIIHPPAIAAGARVSETVSIRAIPATIAALLGIDGTPFGEPLPAVAPDGTGEALMSLRYNDNHADAVARGRWQLIRTVAADSALEELLNLGDPSAIASDSLAALLRDRLQLTITRQALNR